MGMLICGRMSVGVVTMEATPKIAISSATITNVYGLSRAKRTIHISALSAFAVLERAISGYPIQNGQSAPVSSRHIVRASRERLSPKYWFLVVRCPTPPLVMQSHFQTFFARKKRLDRSVSRPLRVCRSPISPACKPDIVHMLTTCPPEDSHVCCATNP